MANSLRLILLLCWTTFSFARLESSSFSGLRRLQDETMAKPNSLSIRSSGITSRALEEVANNSTQAPSTQAAEATTDDGLDDQGDATNESTDDGANQGEIDEAEQDNEQNDVPQSGESNGDDDGTSVVSVSMRDMYSTPPDNWGAFDWFVVAFVLSAWGFICIWVWSVIQQCRRWCCPKKKAFDNTKLDMSELSSHYSRHADD